MTVLESTFLLVVCFLLFSGSGRKEMMLHLNFLLIKETKIPESFCKLESKEVTVCSVNNSRYDINNEDPR